MPSCQGPLRDGLRHVKRQDPVTWDPVASIGQPDFARRPMECRISLESLGHPEFNDTTLDPIKVKLRSLGVKKGILRIL